jgi:hypothetical protein
MGSNVWHPVSRRRLLRRAASGGLAVTTAAMFACSGTSNQGTAAPSTASVLGTPQAGGTYNGQTGTGGTLDPQVISRPPGDLARQWCDEPPVSL